MRTTVLLGVDETKAAGVGVFRVPLFGGAAGPTHPSGYDMHHARR